MSSETNVNLTPKGEQKSAIIDHEEVLKRAIQASEKLRNCLDEAKQFPPNNQIHTSPSEPKDNMDDCIRIRTNVETRAPDESLVLTIGGCQAMAQALKLSQSENKQDHVEVVADDDKGKVDMFANLENIVNIDDLLTDLE